VVVEQVLKVLSLSPSLSPTDTFSGWGVYLSYSLTGITPINDAIAGRSARSYTNESRFTTITNAVSPGDFVIIEFGHNDGGSLSTDNGRSDCLGSGNETCTTAAGVVVQTYVTYLTDAAKAIIAKGAKVIISSPTPDDTCETGTCTYTASRFTGYCEIVVQNAGEMASFVDHGQYVANEFAKLGADTVNGYYPIDHTHTSPVGANIVAAQFVKGVLCANDSFAAYVKNTTASIDGTCL
jgi:rhamnogalacturonan acetylesterase